MKQRTGIRMRTGTRRGTKAAVAAGLAVAAVATVGGCSFARPRVVVPSYYPPPTPTPTGYGSAPSYEPTYSPSPTQETYDPDGRSDVTGRGCEFSNSLRQFTYTVTIRNPSSTDTFSYDMAINWMKARPADGNAYGLHERSIVVRPGDTETYTAKYTVNQSSIGQFWFTCQVTRAHKTRM
ncbi:hypothetical protein SSP35_05_00400 [Streptomyces sp. NBRC 110611]|uniref:hypothetical protein n=1 Tax=Streptomyces sp. NBRC 110611 TaxID=1621259 RepID=UPI000833E615|nr:hypothetical protein [Streptomyces sp. NBRC 110611]GAU67473.1 hypothetical protein SSP35_05_00400 [Streptomyces sp. NBRC 110611]